MISTNNASNLLFMMLYYHLMISCTLQLDYTWQQLQAFKGTDISTYKKYYKNICEEIGQANNLNGYDKDKMASSVLYDRWIDLYPDSKSNKKQTYKLKLLQCAYMEERARLYPNSYDGITTEMVQFDTRFIGRGLKTDDVMEYTQVPSAREKVKFYKNREGLLRDARSIRIPIE